MQKGYSGTEITATSDITAKRLVEQDISHTESHLHSTKVERPFPARI
jgi:hypothetical protein